MTLDVSKIRAVCFDVDGTLSDTDDAWVHLFSHGIGKVLPIISWKKSRFTARRLIISAESPANLIYRMLDWMHLDGPLARLYNRIAHKRTSTRLKNFWVIPGVIDLLNRLDGKYPMTVVSARDEHSTLQFLSQYSLLDHFKVIVTAQTCIFTKPFPDPALYAAEKMGVAPEHCVMVGDTTVDILSGKRAGMQTVGVLCGFGTEKELRRAGADEILATTADLGILLKISEKNN